MRLLGVFEKDSKEMLLLQDRNTFFIQENSSVNESFENYELLKNRDKYIGNGKTQGDGVFNFRYGPVTGGVNDAGVFNIYTHGERILSVNIDPNYKKRDIESMMRNLSIEKAYLLSESVCSNFAFSHSNAFLRAVEDAGNFSIDSTTKRIRIIALELERIYNHLYVIARLSKGASQNVLTSHLEGLFEESLRTNRIFSGSRFLKNLNSFFIDKNKIGNLDEIKSRIQKLKKDFRELYSHSLESWNFIDRIYNTAVLTGKSALNIGITGPTLRACSIAEDSRTYNKLYKNFNPITKDRCDALSRMQVRAEEIMQSCDIVEQQIDKIGSKEQQKKDIDISKISGMGIGYCESPTGIVAYFVELKKGIVENVYISTPSVFGFKAFCDSFVGYIFTDFSFSYDSFGINFADCSR